MVPPNQGILVAPKFCDYWFVILQILYGKFVFFMKWYQVFKPLAQTLNFHKHVKSKSIHKFKSKG